MTRRKSRFSAEIDKLKKKITDQAVDKTKRIHRAMMEELVDATRVDSGVLRANWTPSLNSPSDEWSTFGVNIGGGIEDWPRGEQLSIDFAIDQATNIPDFKLGDVIINTNNVPYGQDSLQNDASMAGIRELMILAAQQEAKKK